MTVAAHSVPAECPFCDTPTAYQWDRAGLAVTYGKKCQHVYEVTREYGPDVVIYRCSEDHS